MDFGPQIVEVELVQGQVVVIFDNGKVTILTPQELRLRAVDPHALGEPIPEDTDLGFFRSTTNW